MTIKVFPSHMEGLPIETHEWTGTLAGFFASNGIDYTKKDPQPITVTVNGEWLPFDEWASRHLEGSDEVKVCLNTQYGGVFKAIGRVFNFLFGWLLPSQRSPSRHDPGQGRALESASAKANEAKLGQVVPELAGRFIRYPDYLTPPRRRFVSPREQWVEFLACVGPGQYQILPHDIKIGDTRIESLGEGAEYQIFEPGQSVAGHSAHEHWHSVAEVGSTSSGTAGLELPSEPDAAVNTDPASYSFNGLSITRPSGTWPSGWGVGTIVRVDYPRTYTVSLQQIGSGDDTQYYRNTYTGYFGHVNVNTLTKTSGSFTYSAVVLSGSDGYLTLGFYSSENGRWYEDDAAGSRVISYGSSEQWTIQSISEDTIVLEPRGSRIFQNESVAGSKVIFVDVVYGEWTSTISACPAGEVTNLIELDFFFPSGLNRIEDDGTVVNRSVRTEIQWRDADAGGPFTSVMRTYTERTLNQVGYTWQIEVPSIRPEVRVRRVGVQSTSTQVNDTIQWFGLKSRLPTRTSYPDWTTIAIRMRSGGKLGSNAENRVNLVATRILPTLQSDGAWSAAQPTRDISAFVRYIARSIGYTDENIDMAELRRLHALWTSRGETCDFIFDLTTVKEALNLTLGAGMAELTIADGQIRPVRDGVRTQFEQSYSPQNMTKPLNRTFRARRHDDPDGVEVEYTDSETWTQQTIICALPGSQHLKLEKLRLQGVTDRVRAWRIGMRRARELAYQRWEYSFGTEMDALNSEYGGYVALFDDVPGYGQSALLQHIAPVSGGVVLHVSEPLEWEEGKEHVVAYRRPDGTLAGPWPATQGPDEFSVVAPIPSGQRPVVSLKLELPHVYFGTAERWTFPALIKQISPNGMEAASVSAVNYDERIYADDDNYPPN